VLRGFGTANIDGVVAPGEWDAAGRTEFAANVPVADGGGTMPATLLVMNDATTLYLAVGLAQPRASGLVEFEFDDNDDGDRADGNDVISAWHPFQPTRFNDEFRWRLGTVYADTHAAAGLPPPGTTDGAAVAGPTGAVTAFELSHPLDSADDAHDFSLHVGSVVGFRLLVLFTTASPCSFPDPVCLGETYVPSESNDSNTWGDIRVTSQNTTPPETRVTGFDFGSGPGAQVTRKTRVRFTFTGEDDLIRPAELVFECSLDRQPFALCASPWQSGMLQDGEHRFRVRAVDEAGNVDATPAGQTWSVDTTPPAKPTIAGPRRTSLRRPTFLLASRDALTRPSDLRFECSLDGQTLRTCGRRYRPLLRAGRHTLRVRAVDRAGNASPIARLRVVMR
jgi:hypothetical protein